MNLKQEIYLILIEKYLEADDAKEASIEIVNMINDLLEEDKRKLLEGFSYKPKVRNR